MYVILISILSIAQIRSQKITKHLKRCKKIEWQKNNDSEKMNILDIYACCMNKSHWTLILEFETENNYHHFENMILHKFAKIFYGKNECKASD